MVGDLQGVAFFSSTKPILETGATNVRGNDQRARIIVFVG